MNTISTVPTTQRLREGLLLVAIFALANVLLFSPGCGEGSSADAGGGLNTACTTDADCAQPLRCCYTGNIVPPSHCIEPVDGGVRGGPCPGVPG